MQSYEDMVSAIEGGKCAFQAEDGSLDAIERFQLTYEILQEMEYDGLIQIIGRHRESHTGHRLIDHVMVRLPDAA